MKRKSNRKIKSKYVNGQAVMLKKSFNGFLRSQILYVIDCYKRYKPIRYCILVSENPNDNNGIPIPTKYLKPIK